MFPLGSGNTFVFATLGGGGGLGGTCASYSLSELEASVAF